jgi:hypothetical protein
VNHPTDPRPREAQRPFSEFEWPIVRSFACPIVEQPPDRLFSDIVEDRRAIREMAELTLKEVVNTVAYVCLPRFRKHGDATIRTKSLAMSAGALHPISLVVVHAGQFARAFVYEPLTHCLNLLRANGADLNSLVDHARSILTHSDGTLIAFVADPSKTDACYENASSLLWRDAGALMQSTALAATAFGQAFCPLGVLGHEVPKSLNAESELIPCGIAMLGRKFL